MVRVWLKKHFKMEEGRLVTKRGDSPSRPGWSAGEMDGEIGWLMDNDDG